MISDAIRNQLYHFTSTVWGNPQAVLKRDPSGFEYIDVEEYQIGLQALFLSPTISKILVRDEYRTALQELQTDTYARGAYVTGQPGIGKTLFLVYLLVELLGQCRKVVVHDTDGQFYAIFANHAVEFYLLTNQTPLDPDKSEPDRRIWALSDSGAAVRSPPTGFWSFKDRHIRTIQATSPRKDHWHKWSKLATANCYVMDVWTEQEITNLANLSGFDVQRMMVLHRKWGGAPRTLLEYVDIPDQHIEAVYRQSARLAVAKCRTMISSIEVKNISEDTMTQFYFCRPLNFASPSIDREYSCVVVPTPTICHVLAEALQKLNDSIRLEFFDALSFPTETRQAARYIYKSWLHCFLSAGRSIDCHWSHRRANSTSESLRGTTILISARSDELKDVKKLPYYWVAPPKFPGIDGALIRQDAIIAVQVTIRAKHKPPEEGLEKLQNDLPPHLKNLPWHLVFVGNTDWTLERVANEWAGKIFLPTSKRCVTVGWSQVDPVEEGITYRITCDENHQLEEELMEVEDEE